jgi:hypothetical protein
MQSDVLVSDGQIACTQNDVFVPDGQIACTQNDVFVLKGILQVCKVMFLF